MTYSGQVVSALSTTFTPMASGMEASGRMDDVRRLLIRGTQATLALSMPITLALLFRGRTFIGLWMGPNYAQISGTVLQILLIAGFMSTAASTAGAVMMAIGRHKRPAQFAMVEAAVNVALTLLLVRRLGMYGVAWGTSIAITLVSMAFWPGYIKKVLGIPIGTMVWEGWVKPVLCAVPYGVVCWLADRVWHPANLATFFLQILVDAAAGVCGVGGDCVSRAGAGKDPGVAGVSAGVGGGCGALAAVGVALRWLRGCSFGFVSEGVLARPLVRLWRRLRLPGRVSRLG